MCVCYVQVFDVCGNDDALINRVCYDDDMCLIMYYDVMMMLLMIFVMMMYELLF